MTFADVSVLPTPQLPVFFQRGRQIKTANRKRLNDARAMMPTGRLHIDGKFFVVSTLSHSSPSQEWFLISSERGKSGVRFTHKTLSSVLGCVRNLGRDYCDEPLGPEELFNSIKVCSNFVQFHYPGSYHSV